MIKITFYFFISLFLTRASIADHYPRNPNIDVLHYTFNLILSDSSDAIQGETEIEIKFTADGINEFALDLYGKDSSAQTGMAVSRVTENGEQIKFLHAADRLKIFLSASSIKNEVKIFSIKYSGIPADGLIISKNKYNDRTFFGDNWPNRAHYWLPTIDHPYDKAACDFFVTAPSEYRVIANGSFISETTLNKSFKLTHWKESVPIPTKVMVIGAARFDVQYLWVSTPSGKDSNNIPIEAWVYPQDKEKGFYDFSPAEEIIKLYSGLIGPYPYEKLADVESKTKYGGMENAGNIFYAESEITGTRKSLVTVAHEIAHQWFGDAVTEKDWNHIWLSEGFATFFQNIFIENHFGMDSLLGALSWEKEQIIDYNKINPDSPVVDTTITNLNDLLNVNSYQKGAWILRMLQHVLGDDVFWKGIRLYYKTFMNKNADTKDFETIMESVSNKDLSWFFQEWLYKPGLPFLKGNWSYDTTSSRLIIKINQIESADTGEGYNSGYFKMPMDIGIYTENNVEPEIMKIEIEKDVNTFEVYLKLKPSKVILDPNQWLLMETEFNKR
jgi:aminopeptidase N